MINRNGREIIHINYNRRKKPNRTAAEAVWHRFKRGRARRPAVTVYIAKSVRARVCVVCRVRVCRVRPSRTYRKLLNNSRRPHTVGGTPFTFYRLFPAQKTHRTFFPVFFSNISFPSLIVVDTQKTGTRVWREAGCSERRRLAPTHTSRIPFS